MAILKHTAVLIIVLFGFQALHSQDQEKLNSAFSSSYISEGKGDYSKAIEALKGVFDKSSYEINLRLGWLSYKAGLLDESESYYRRAVQILPYGLEARFGLIYPISSAGNWDQVIAVYEEILEIDPQNTLANFRLALVYYGQENYAKAEKLFSKVVNLYPFDYDGNHMLAWTKLKSGKIEEAKSLFYKALLYKPGDASSLEGLSLIR